MFEEPSRVFVTSGGRDVDDNALTLKKNRNHVQMFVFVFLYADWRTRSETTLSS